MSALPSFSEPQADNSVSLDFKVTFFFHFKSGQFSEWQAVWD